MTYIEFFDKTAVENVAALLTFQPERILFIGTRSQNIYDNMLIYETIAREHGLQTEFLKPKIVTQSNLKGSLQILQEIVDENDVCIFDLTGGEEILCFALGMICAWNPEKDIRLHKFQLRNDQVVDCDPDGNESCYVLPPLTVRDQIRIYGGDIVYGTVDSEETYHWTVTEQLRAQVDQHWTLCREHTKDWNVQMTVLDAIEQYGKPSQDKLTVTANVNVLSSRLSRSNQVFHMNEKLLGILAEQGYLSWSQEEDTVTVTYRDLQTKRILSKAGTLLEMKIFLTAIDLRDDYGDPIYQDGETGVKIDWDGRQQEETASYDDEGNPVPDIENEIDVILMHGGIPVFISCKNGTVDEDELYKFGTVSDRFGAKYAKKVLVVNRLRGSDAKYIRKRADDMGITLLEQVQKMSDWQLRNELDHLWY